ncbi:MAG: ABC transporter ATP-binding protein/permease [Bacillota bacterium]|nr:ABC transporter ATP-binding protein/permease [Bacillota bacterium]
MRSDKKKINFSHPENPNFILSYVKKYKGRFLVTAVSGIIFNSAIVFGPIFQGKLLDSAVSSKGLNSIIITALEFILVTLSFQIARLFKRYYVRDMANRISGDMRTSILESILNTALNSLEKQKIGDMMSTAIGDVDITVEAIRKTITEIWDTGVLMAAYFIALLFYDYKLTLIAAVPIPIVIIFAQMMRKLVQSKSKLSRKANSKTTIQVRKMISEINILRLYGREDAELKRFKERLRIQAKSTAISEVLKNGLAPLYSSFAQAGIILVIAYGGDKVINGSWSVGSFTAYITMFIALAVRTTTAAKVFNIQQGAKASWERVKSLIKNSEEIKSHCAKTLIPKEIKVENLSFKYRAEDKFAIENISFTVKSGMIVGVTGPVGCGKSTLALALTGLYDYSGKIFLDKKEIRDLPYEKRLSSITYMGHNPFLFSNTIENNITWDNTDKEKLKEVINIASLKRDIISFPENIETQVGEKGNKLSGGQKQRISLARALYKDADIVILDDPFSAVDIGTEAEIIDNLREKADGRTIFIFSHRLEAFKYTDLILVLNKGKIAEKGTHKELLDLNGIYSMIYDSQKFIGVDL